jgi:hypothetical protein
MRIRTTGAAIAAATLAVPAVAWCAPAEPRTYVIAVGYNDPPSDSQRDDHAPDRLPSLRFADDDAIAFYTFLRPLAEYGALLTIPDADSRLRFSAEVNEARPPSLAELRSVVKQVGQLIDADLQAGREPSVLFFYSGHGTADDGDGPASLTLIDGRLTREVLYDEVLAALPARYIHLFIDACHAEAVVRPRDLQAKVVDLGDREVTAYAERATLARFPNVGAVIASSSTSVAHEWDAYGSGVFTHEILSGLRGAADVNGDDRVEYSELAAFVAAANREVGDPRAHLHAVVAPPRINPRVALVDLGRLPRAGRLQGRPAGLGELYLEDASGQRLVDLRAEAGFAVKLAVPADRTLFIRRRADEAEARLRPGQVLAFEQLAFRPLASRDRGALTTALRNGLFATPFGPLYYRGFADGQPDMTPIPLIRVEPPPVAVVEAPQAPPPPPRPGRSTTATTLYISAGALAAGAGVFGGLTYEAYRDHANTQLQVPADDADRRFQNYGITSVALLSAAAVAALAGAYLQWRESPRGGR